MRSCRKILSRIPTKAALLPNGSSPTRLPGTWSSTTIRRAGGAFSLGCLGTLYVGGWREGAQRRPEMGARGFWRRWNASFELGPRESSPDAASVPENGSDLEAMVPGERDAGSGA